MIARAIALAFLLLLPVALRGNTMESKESTMTKNDLFSIRDAIRSYQKEYGYLPPADLSLVLMILQGNNIRGFNWKEIVFWEPRSDKKLLWITTGQGNVSARGELLDGWGRLVVFTAIPDTGSIEMWSRGKDGDWERATAIKKDFYWTIK